MLLYTLLPIMILSVTVYCKDDKGMNFTFNLNKSGEFIDLMLNCKVSEPPHNLTIQRKYPMPFRSNATYTKSNNSTSKTVVVKSKHCFDIIGPYECIAQYEQQPLISKDVYVPMAECHPTLCNAEQNHTVIRAAVNETVSLTVCIFGQMTGMSGEIVNINDTKLMNYHLNPEINRETLSNFMKIILYNPSEPENFGLYKIKIKQNHITNSLTVYIQLEKKEMPRLCQTTKNNSVINVIENTATTHFCVTSRYSINNIAVNDNYILFNNASSNVSIYKLSTETGNSSTHYTLQVFNVTRESQLNYYVVLETEFNLTLRYNFNVTFLEDPPKLCNETKNDTLIEAVDGKLAAHFCIITKENITAIRVNEQSIFDGGLLPSPRYTLTNQTHQHFRNFTLEIHNVTDVATHSYKVNILMKSGLELLYAFHVSLSKHVPKNCSSTQNSSNLVFLDNIATIYLCVNKRTSISEIKFENVPGVEYDTSEIVQYTNTTIHLEDGIQYSIKLFNITRNVPFGIRVKLLEASGNMSKYIFYRMFPEGNVSFKGTLSQTEGSMAYDLDLECVATDNPITVTIRRKRPPTNDFYVQETNISQKIEGARGHFKGLGCLQALGTYECQTVYGTKSSIYKEIFIPIPTCAPMLCNDQENTSQIYAGQGETVNVTVCVFGNVNETYGEIDTGASQRHLNYVVDTTNDAEQMRRHFRFSITISSIVDFGSYVIRVTSSSYTHTALTYPFKLFPTDITEISSDCFTTENATRLNVVKNKVTISMCVKTADTISSLAMNDHPIIETLSDLSPRYAIRNKTLGQHTAYTIEFSNLNKDIARNVTLGVTSSGQYNEYYFDLFFPEGIHFSM